jgi:hypothetical protein
MLFSGILFHLNRKGFYLCVLIYTERMGLVSRLVFKTNSRRITPAVAGSIPALSAFFVLEDN